MASVLNGTWQFILNRLDMERGTTYNLPGHTRLISVPLPACLLASTLPAEIFSQGDCSTGLARNGIDQLIQNVIDMPQLLQQRLSLVPLRSLRLSAVQLGCVPPFGVLMAFTKEFC